MNTGTVRINFIPALLPLLAAMFLAACSDGHSGTATEEALDVRSAADQCIADPAVAHDPGLRTHCTVTRLAEACAGNAAADPACSQPDANFQQRLGEVISDFCLLEYDYQTLAQGIVACVENFSMGCAWVGFDVQDLAICTVDSASVICGAPLVDSLPLCRDGRLVLGPGPYGEPLLLNALLESLRSTCEGSPEALCETPARNAFCEHPLAQSMGLCS